MVDIAGIPGPERAMRLRTGDGVGAQPCYRLVGEKVGDAFKAGLALK